MSQVMTRTSRAFRGRVLGKLRQTEGEGGVLGEADILVAVFDVPDTDPAVGNTKRQVIDQGSFRTWIEGTDFEETPVLFLRDHGGAHITGFVDSSMTLGFADSFRETEDGLVYTGHYNLNTQEGADAYERLRFSPGTTQFSFRWDEDVVEEDDNGVEHVTEFKSVEEVSQVGFGAQALTKPLGWRTAVASHDTATSDGSWDGPENEGRLPSDATATALRTAYAWQDPDGDAETKAAYRFIHHEVGEDGAVGAANVKACQSGIGVLNGGRGGTTIPDDDVQGVYDHMAGHLRDADVEPPELRAPDEPEDGKHRAAASLDDLSWAVREAFMAAHPAVDGSWGHWAEEVYAEEDLRAGFVIVRHQETADWSKVPWERNAEGDIIFQDDAAEPVAKVWQTIDGEPLVGRATRAGGEHEPLPSKSTLREWVKHDSFRKSVESVLEEFRAAEEEGDGEREPEAGENGSRAAAATELRALYATIYGRPSNEEGPPQEA